MKRLLVVLLCLAICFGTALAHSGRTDGSGGHWDRSSGEYHYHHGHKAHQHIDGVCPYDFEDKTSHSSGSQGSSNSAQVPSLKSNTSKKEAKEEKTLISRIFSLFGIVFLIVIYAFLFFGWALVPFVEWLQEKLRKKTVTHQPPVEIEVCSMQLKGQSNLLKIWGIDTLLEDRGIRVYADEQQETVYTEAFAEICDMLTEQRRAAYNAERAYERRVSALKKKAVIFAVIGAVVLGCLVYHFTYNKAFEEGREKGYDAGHKAGYTSGLYDGYNKVAAEYEYFNEAAVIITPGGSKYHRFACSHIDDREVYILNVEAAVDLGYKACLDCKKDLSFGEWTRLNQIEESNSFGSSTFGGPFKETFVETHQN